MMKAIVIGPFRVSPHTRDGKHTGGWVVNVPANLAGSRRRKFFDNCEDATTYAKGLERLYRSGGWAAATPASSPSATISFREAVARWLRSQEARVRTLKKRPVSLATDGHRLQAALKFFGDVELSAITENRLEKFQEHRLEGGLQPTTVNSDLIVVGKVLRWSVKVGLLAKLPTVERIPEPPRKPAIPTQEEVARIIHAMPEHLRPLVRLMGETGCRSGEAFNLTWDCVDEANSTVEFTSKEQWTPKTRQSYRVVPISRGLLADLQALPKVGEYVFSGKTAGEPVTTMRKSFASAVATADIRRNGKVVRITPHTLRKAYATWAVVDWCIPQPVLQSILGHAPGSTVTNAYYVMVSEEAKRKAVVELPL